MHQVATDTRLWLYGALQDTRAYLADLIKTAIDRAERDVDVIMPGFTHLQACFPHMRDASRGADYLPFVLCFAALAASACCSSCSLPSSGATQIRGACAWKNESSLHLALRASLAWQKQEGVPLAQGPGAFKRMQCVG